MLVYARGPMLGAHLLAGVLAAAPAPSEGEDVDKPQESREARRAARRENMRRRFTSNDPTSPPPGNRKWMVGIEGVVMQAPPLRTEVVTIDARFVGRSVALGGLGVFGRYRPLSIVGFDLAIRSGSVRYGGRGDDSVTSQDQVMIDPGVMLYVGRGDVAQFAFSGGLGAMFTRIGYDLDNGPDGRQFFGSGLVRAGAEAEFIVKRVAFVLAFRTYGIFTDRSIVTNRGELFDVTGRDAPVAAVQTVLVGSAGIAYRF